MESTKRQKIWRILADGMRSGAGKSPWIFEGDDDVDHSWAVFNCKTPGLMSSVVCSHGQRGHTWDSRKKLSRFLGRSNRARRYHRCTGKGQFKYRVTMNVSTVRKSAKMKAHEEHLAEDSRPTPTSLYAYLRKRSRACPRILMLMREAFLGDCGSQQLRCLRDTMSLWMP